MNNEKRNCFISLAILRHIVQFIVVLITSLYRLIIPDIPIQFNCQETMTIREEIIEDESIQFNQEGESIPIIVLRNILKPDTSDDIKYLQWRNVCQNWNNIILYYNTNLTLNYFKYNGKEKWSFNEKFNNAVNIQELCESNIIKSVREVRVHCNSSDLNCVIEQLNDKLSAAECYNLYLHVKYVDAYANKKKLSKILSLKDYIPNCNLTVLICYFNNDSSNIEQITNMIRFLMYKQNNIWALVLIGIKIKHLSALVENFYVFNYSLKYFRLLLRYNGIFSQKMDNIFEKIIQMFPYISGFHVVVRPQDLCTNLDISDSNSFKPKWIAKLSSLSKWKYLTSLTLTFQFTDDEIRQQIYDMKRMNGDLLSLKELYLCFEIEILLHQDNGEIVCEVVQIFERSARNVSDFKLQSVSTESFISSVYLNKLTVDCPNLVKALRVLALTVPQLNENIISERIEYRNSLKNLFQHSICLEKFYLYFGGRVVERRSQFEILQIVPKTIKEFELGNYIWYIESAYIFELKHSYELFPFNLASREHLLGLRFDNNYIDWILSPWQKKSEMNEIVQQMNELENKELFFRIKMRDINSHRSFEHSTWVIYYMFGESIKKYKGQSKFCKKSTKVTMKFSWSLQDNRKRDLKVNINFYPE